MTPDALRAALATPDVDAVRRAVSTCADHLRAPTDAIDAPGLADVLLSLAAHPHEKVREDVANACDAFPDPFFDHALAALGADIDAYVRAALERAADRRARRKKAQARRAEKEKVLEAILAEIESTYDPAARRLAERAVRRGVERFVANLEHEMGKVNGALDESFARLRVELASARPNAGALRKDVEEVERRVAFARAVVKRGRAYAAKVQAEIAPVHVADLVAEARAQLFARLGDGGQNVVFEAEVDDGLVVDADAHALLQALQNLVQNAVESYDGARAARLVRVTAKARRRGSEVEICVIDRGAGMTERTKASLFTPFESDKRGGTGMGMSVVRAMIVDVHGGSLTIDTVRGKGTTMTCVLPARERAARARRTS